MGNRLKYLAGLLVLTALCLSGMWLSDRMADQKQMNTQALQSSDAAQQVPCDHDEAAFCSHLPLICITSGEEAIEYGVPHWCRIDLIDHPNGCNHPDDAPTTTSAATIWHRGQSSSRFEKKPYGISLYKKQGDAKEQDLPLLGMAEGSDWVLHGPYLDKSLMQNRLMYTIARETMFWAPDTRYCEVFLDGEYEGIYLLVESPRVSKTRIRFADYALQSGETPYLLQRNRVGTDVNMVNSFGTYSSHTSYPVYIRYPNERRLTQRQYRWIETDLSKFERALYSEYFRDPERGYRAYIDLDSFVTYYILTEFSMNKDSGYLSTYFCKDIGGKLMMGPIWDLNNGFDNYPGYPTAPGADGDGFYIADNNWFERMMQDPAFVDAVVQKYRTLRKGVLSTENLLKMVDATEAYLGESIERNSERWAYSFERNFLGKDENHQSREMRSHVKAVLKLKRIIRVRGKYLDENIEQLYHLCMEMEDAA